MVVGTLCKHLRRADGYLHLGDGGAVLLLHLKRATFVLLHQLVHALRDDTHSHSVLHDDVVGGAHEEVSLAGNPLRASLGLDAFADVNVVVIDPRHAEGGHDVEVHACGLLGGDEVTMRGSVSSWWSHDETSIHIGARTLGDAQVHTQ